MTSIIFVEFYIKQTSHLFRLNDFLSSNFVLKISVKTNGPKLEVDRYNFYLDIFGVVTITKFNMKQKICKLFSSYKCM